MLMSALQSGDTKRWGHWAEGKDNMFEIYNNNNIEHKIFRSIFRNSSTQENVEELLYTRKQRKWKGTRKWKRNKETQTNMVN